MKAIYYAISAALILFSSCNNSIIEKPSSGMGKLSMNVQYGGSYTKAGEPEVDDFLIEIRDEQDIVTHSFLYSEAPQILEVPVGNYTITANSTPSLPAAFDQPVYEGVTHFVVSEDQLTPVTVNCSISNMKVTIVLAPEFIEEFQAYKLSICNAPSWESFENILIWNQSELEAGKAGYFSVAPLMLKLNAHRKTDDSQVNFLYTIEDVAAADHHRITVGAQITGSVNGLNIVLDHSVNDKPVEVFIPGFDEIPVPGTDEGGDEPQAPEDPEIPESPNLPSLVWPANPSFAEYPLADEMDVEMTITAPEGIKTFVIDVDSPILTDVVASLAGDNWSYASQGAYTMDLINNEALVEALGQMSVPVGEQLRGQTQVIFSLSQLVPLINMYQPELGSKHIFRLTVTDNKDQSYSKSLCFVKL